MGSIGWILTLAYFAILAADNAVAQTRGQQLPAFEFRGHTIGEPIDKSFPYWQLSSRDIELPSCHKDSSEVEQYSCDDATARVKNSLRNVIGDIEISFLVYKFYNKKMYSLMMSFRSVDYNVLRSMLIGKYGNPNIESPSTQKNSYGVSFDNITSEWLFREGMLVLYKRFSKVDTSLLVFQNEAVEKEISAARSLKLQQRGKSAF